MDKLETVLHEIKTDWVKDKTSFKDDPSWVELAGIEKIASDLLQDLGLTRIQALDAVYNAAWACGSFNFLPPTQEAQKLLTADNNEELAHIQITTGGDLVFISMEYDQEGNEKEFHYYRY